MPNLICTTRRNTCMTHLMLSKLALYIGMDRTVKSLCTERYCCRRRTHLNWTSWSSWRWRSIRTLKLAPSSTSICIIMLGDSGSMLWLAYYLQQCWRIMLIMLWFCLFVEKQINSESFIVSLYLAVVNPWEGNKAPTAKIVWHVIYP